MLFFINEPEFCKTTFIEFKYISCYSLSVSSTDGRLLYASFKYISCYSLSRTGENYNGLRIDSNTSHVILYL